MWKAKLLEVKQYAVKSRQMHLADVLLLNFTPRRILASVSHMP